MSPNELLKQEKLLQDFWHSIFTLGSGLFNEN
jgi:hypothetical protein